MLKRRNVEKAYNFVYASLFVSKIGAPFIGGDGNPNSLISLA